MRRLAARLGRPIIVDETACRVDDLDALGGDPAQWIVNVRVSKTGGLLRSLEMVDAARARGLRVVVGAHVGETSVLTRAALMVVQAARGVLFAQEGAFGTHLLQHDVTQPPLMFGAGGVLDADALRLARGAGLGLAIVSP
jgi:L-alanine-DL-glutamate epimerase-like enolase superfamily enzyme